MGPAPRNSPEAPATSLFRGGIFSRRSVEANGLRSIPVRRGTTGGLSARVGWRGIIPA